jgi:hypothetical protein
MAGKADDDDGFGDFLQEDEEANALQHQELAAWERKMKTVRLSVSFFPPFWLQMSY